MDILDDLATPLPVIVIAELLGVPIEDRWHEDLVPTVRRSCVVAFSYAEGNEAEVSFDDGGIQQCDVMMNPLAIEQALIHLIRNALASKASGAKVEIRLRLAGEFVEVLVEDNGRGISQRELEEIFDPFFTIRAGEDGCGVSLSHSIAEAHRGRLVFRNEPGVGTVATLSLPLGA